MSNTKCNDEFKINALKQRGAVSLFHLPVKLTDISTRVSTMASSKSRITSRASLLYPASSTLGCQFSFSYARVFC